MFDKVARHFYDDTCVVPEKVDGEFVFQQFYIKLQECGSLNKFTKNIQFKNDLVTW